MVIYKCWAKKYNYVKSFWFTWRIGPNIKEGSYKTVIKTFVKKGETIYKKLRIINIYFWEVNMGCS